MRLIRATAILAAVLALPAAAATVPSPGGGDSRLRNATFDSEAVYVLHGEIGRALFVRFAEDEEMERFYAGDSAAWEVAKHRNFIAIKPTAVSPDTNLVVITNKDRAYTFDLDLSGPAMYGIRFRYPAEVQAARNEQAVKSELAAALDPYQQINKNYRYSGAGQSTIAPREIFDTGTHTFLRFPENMTFPAIFAVGPDGKETLTNGTVRGNWLVLGSVGEAWRLRYGRAVLCIRNDQFAPSEVDNPGETATPAIERVTE